MPYVHQLSLHIYDEKKQEYIDSKSSVLTMVDDYTKVRIVKKDLQTKKNLVGARLRLMKGNTIVKEWVSGKEAEEFDYLPVGEYTLTELMVPEGYDKAKDMKIIVKDTGEVQKFVMYDGRSVGRQDSGAPQTGDSLRIVIYLVAIVFLAGSFGFVWYTDPKRKAKRLTKKQQLKK